MKLFLMKDNFVSHEIAKQLNEKGYNELDFGYWRLKLDEEVEPFKNVELMFFRERYDNHNFRFERHKQYEASCICTAPTYQQAVDFFRENHDIFIRPYPISKTSYGFHNVSVETGEAKQRSDRFYPSYYEALDKAIEAALKLI